MIRLISHWRSTPLPELGTLGGKQYTVRPVAAQGFSAELIAYKRVRPRSSVKNLTLAGCLHNLKSFKIYREF